MIQLSELNDLLKVLREISSLGLSPGRLCPTQNRGVLSGWFCLGFPWGFCPWGFCPTLYLHIHPHIGTCVYAYTITHVYARTHRCTHAKAHTHSHTLTFIHSRIDAHTYNYTRSYIFNGCILSIYFLP